MNTYSENVKDEKRLISFLEHAKIEASLSYAKRLKVGAIAVRENRIICVGRNGTPPGTDNNCETEDNHTKPEVVHAEANLICWAARKGISLENSSLVITHSPCIECSKLILTSGIKEVFYEEEYRDLMGVDFLKKNKIKVQKVFTKVK